jgi:hypothetical protein
MTNEDLIPFSRLYRTSRYMGSDNLFRSYYKLPSDAVVPLSVSHGVDFGHCHRPMEINAIEPVHWSYNAQMHAEASRHKESILAPHPWTLFLDGRDSPAGKGVILIGPPPSPANDAALYKLIQKDIRPDWSILVKARGPYQASMDYWARHGVRPLTAASPDHTFYSRLYELLSSFETVVGCTFSSALVFAASIGRQVRIVQGYHFEAYEHSEYELEINLASERARSVVRTFAREDRAETQELARELLGFNLLDGPARVVSDYHAAVARIRRPFSTDPSLRIPYCLREALAMRLNKPGILMAGFRTYLWHAFRGQTCIMYMSDIDVWLHGKSERNFRLVPVRFVPGVTEPGQAPGAYE